MRAYPVYITLIDEETADVMNSVEGLVYFDGFVIPSFYLYNALAIGPAMSGHHPSLS